MARLLSLLAAFLFSATVYVENVVKDPIAVMYPAVLALSTQGDPNVITCTGVAISPTEFLTARHCVPADGADIWVNRTLKADLVRVSSKQDLALFVLLDGKTFKSWAPLLSREVGHLEELVSVGFPLAENIGHFVVEQGQYQGRTTHNDGKHVYFMTVPVYPGNSGGPLFVWDLGEWKLAGITIAITGFTTPNWTVQLAPKLSFGHFDLREFLAERG